MPKEWAQERGIGAYRNEMTYEKERQPRQREQHISRHNPNVEKFRTGNFIRL